MRPTSPRARASRRDPAIRQAHEVVGLYGDPDTSWGIAIDLGVRSLDPEQVCDRLAALCASHQHLGVAPTVEVVATADWSARRADLAMAPYAAGALLRVALRQDGRRLALGAHHGAVDGLGLVSVAGVAIGQPLRALARGIGQRPARSGFVRSSVQRLGEALVDPPPRFAGSGEPSDREDLSELTRPLIERGTAHLAVAVADVFEQRGHDGRPLLVVGASRRVDALPAPDRRTAYLRLRVPHGATPGQVRRSLAAVDPEPDFPSTSARGLGPRVTHLMRRRLGATALLSNLGQIEGPVESVAMFPACSGPRAVAIGLASTRTTTTPGTTTPGTTTPGTTTLTLRTRRSEFSVDEHTRLLADLGERLFGQ